MAQSAQLKRLFECAISLEPTERAAWLAQACGTNLRLRDELISLLAAHDASIHYFEDLSGRLVPSALSAMAAALDAGGGAGEEMGNYRVIERIGSGAMGAVYRAHDVKLDRFVAIKFLPQHLSADVEAKRRFMTEARAASALDHPAIGVVHEIGETSAGQPYIVMAYYDGETLAERIRRAPLSAQDARAFGTCIAAGLAAAHRHGIVHRDVKPSNIIIRPDGEIKIVDFGVAKIKGAAITKTQRTLGTVAYMSPEQTRGDAVDGRTDLWSLGIVLYEMLTGTRPFRAENEQALIYAIRNDEVELPDSMRREDPVLAHIVQRCLCKDVASRYADGEAIVADLSGIAAGAAARWSRSFRRYGVVAGLLVLFLVGAFAVRLRPANGPDRQLAASLASAGGQRIAVLPLVHDIVDPEYAYFAVGMTEELIVRLSKLSGLRVIALRSVARFNTRERDVAGIGRDLKAATILDGEVRQLDELVRITVRLVDVISGQHVWSAEYDVHLENMLAVQREITERVAAALKVQLRRDERLQLTKMETSDARAYELYLRGRYFLTKFDDASSARARDYFQQAIDLDPTFARAWSGLADAYVYLSSVAVTLAAGEAYPRARRAAEQALELDPDLAEAHASLATVLASYYWDSERAEWHFRRALELDPSFAAVHQEYAAHLRNMGRFDEALAEAKLAQELNPLAGAGHIEEGIVLYAARRYDEAIAHYERLLTAMPSFRQAHIFIALAHAHRGEHDQALAALDLADPGRSHPDALGIRGWILARSGRTAAAGRMLDTMKRQSAHRPISAFHEAAVHVGLADHARALDLLEHAAEERTWQMRLLGIEPIFDPLRAEPRFRDLLARIGLE